MSLYGDLNDAKDIVSGGNPNCQKARRFIATTIDRAMRRIVDAEVLAIHVLQAKRAEKSAKKILESLRPKKRQSTMRRKERTGGAIDG